MVKTFDTHSYELATRFLDEYPRATRYDKERLALAIQQAIEDFLEFYVQPE